MAKKQPPRVIEELSAAIDWPRDGWTDRFGLTETQAAFIAEQLDLREPPKDMVLSADIDLAGNGKELVMKFNLHGTVTQYCVVSMEPLVSTVDESFIRRFRQGDFRDQIEIDIAVADGDIATMNEDLEPWPRSAEERPSMLDFVVEQLGLVLDPFPRKEGKEVPEDLLIDPIDKPEKMSPFAALAALKKED